MLAKNTPPLCRANGRIGTTTHRIGNTRFENLAPVDIERRPSFVEQTLLLAQKRPRRIRFLTRNHSLSQCVDHTPSLTQQVARSIILRASPSVGDRIHQRI